MIAKNVKRDFSLFLRDWYRRGLKFLLEEDPGLHFNCWNDKRIFFF